MAGRWVYVGSASGANGQGGAAQALAVHAALLPAGAAGQILYFSGSQWVEPTIWESIENEPAFGADPNYLAGKSQIDHSRIYDCASQQVMNAGSPDVDLFCSGHAFLPDGRLLIAGGTQHFPEAGTVDLHHAHWSGSRETWIYDPHPEIRAAIGSPVTAVWAPYQPDHLDLFMTADDGTVWSTWWEAARGWQPWFTIHPEIKAAIGSPVTAIWAPRQPDHLDLFITGTDGAVWSTGWEVASAWQPWFVIHPEVKAKPPAQITAQWRGQHLDLFMTGTDGTVWSTWWEATPGWQGWFAVHPEIKGAAGASVTAVWAPRQPDHLDLFMTGTDGAVWSAWWEAARGWHEWFAIRPEVKAQPGAAVTALWRGQHLDLFMTEMDGAVRSAWWEAGPGWQAWFAIHPEIRAAAGSTVNAIWAPRQPDHLDLFITGIDGAVWSTWWEAAPGWQGWFLIDPEVKAGPRVALSALWRDQHLDLFLTGTDGAVWSAWWEAARGWQPWFSILATSSWVPGPLMNRDPAQQRNNQPMGGGRWYPTLVTLASGEVLAICGHPLISNFTGNLQDFDIRHNNTKPEIFNRNGTWTLIDRALGADQAHDYAPYYPRLHVVPHTGEVFVVQPLYSAQVVAQDPSNPNCVTPPPSQDLCSDNPVDTKPPYSVDVMDKSLFYDVPSQLVTRSFPGPQNFDPLYLDRFFTSQETTSVLLPLLHEEDYHPRVLIAGAVAPLIADLSPQGSTPLQWTNTAPRRLIDPVTQNPPTRNFANSTLLPTGDVVVSGGVTKVPYKEADGVRTAEVYHPAGGGHADSWEVSALSGETRGYHSVALLMADGRVWTAGSEWNYTGTPNLAIELFEPDYYRVASRVAITASPGIVLYGQSFTVQFQPTSSNTAIARVVFMRLGSATHAWDGDQRYVSVPFTQSGTTLTITAPPDATVAPPGFYMLWLIDANNLPCQSASFVRITTGWQRWFSIWPEVAEADPGAPVTAVWRNPSHLDLFMTGRDGTVWSTWWEAGPGWQKWFAIWPQVAKANHGALVTAVWRDPAHLDLFMTGTDGAVWSTWWEAGPGWQKWFPIWPEVAKAKPGATVSAVWREPLHLDLFVTGSDGTVWSAWWEVGPGWQEWFPVSGAANANPGATVTAVWRRPQHLDLFVSGSDGTVWSAWWEPTGGWRKWFPVWPDVAKSKPGATVTAVWRYPQHLDLFMTGADGTVWSAWWEAAPGWQKWFPIWPQAAKAEPGTEVTAVWRYPQHLDLFITGADGTVWSAWWEASPGWQKWFAIWPQAAKAKPKATVTALWSNPRHLDLFMTDTDGVVWSTWWDIS